MARRNRSFRASGRALDILNSINSSSTSRKQRDRPVRNSRRATHGGESQGVPENRDDIWQIPVSPENRTPSPPAPGHTPPQTLHIPEAEPTPRRSRRLQHEAPENSSPLRDSLRQEEQTSEVEEPEPEAEEEEWVSDGQGSEGSEQVSQEPLEEYNESDEGPDGQQAVAHETATKKRKTATVDGLGDEQEQQNTHDRDQTAPHRDNPDHLSSPTYRRQRRRARSPSRVRIEVPPRASSPARSEASPDSHDQTQTTDRALVVAPESVQETWFDQAQHLGGQEDNWRTLIAVVGVLRKIKVPSVEHYLGDVKGAVDFFRDSYKRAVITPLRAGDTPGSESAAQFDDLLAVIQQEGDQVMDVIYELTNPAKRRDLLDGFGARAIDWAYKVVKQCFRAYYIAGGRYPAARRHFRRALALLSWFCRRLGSLAGRRQMEGRQKELRWLEKSLAKLQAALESRALEPEAREAPEGPGGPIGGGTLRDLAFPYGRKPWTNDEGQALLDGLQRYQGPDRYYRILTQSGRRLLGRTALELREQACQLRDRILTQHGHELHDREGQRKWRWLSSVREN
ncbi:uncharacterized protein BDW47DRAFT_10705 [Aspergillus candidus]|uniref:Uncharacterized protein n=1 Tax=Aspergillus candidus TaxID=41067 RepID=A0A2I2FG31_ASPCN|nr:hypothetical protein BDW47DRAFT_10705 [Aspergillus candidus]PLB39585.1 hypothetical protein BDW47DRAFT_10705 [Aspergillus candidus]